MEADATSKMHPNLADRLHRQRSVFSAGGRIRMNILPMFLNIFMPWGMFVFVLGVCGFWMMYSKPGIGIFLVFLCALFWLGTFFVAVNRRKADPEPSWYSYFSLMIGLAVFFGFVYGTYIFNRYSLPYHMVRDLKVIGHLDANKERGQNVMDAGIFYFAEGNKIDAMKSWHFKQSTVYCVAPVSKGGTPETQSFDFWAVGKDCCSVSSSDFRCGAYNNPLARSAIRVLDEQDLRFYRLAVEQAETLYGIMATHPVFFEWSQDPLEVVNTWNARAFANYILAAVFALVVSLLGVACASCKFAWLGRCESVYGTRMFSDPDYMKGQGYRSTDFDLPNERPV